MRQGERWHQPCEVKTEGVITLKERRRLITHYEVEMEVFTARELGSKEKSVLKQRDKGHHPSARLDRVITQEPGRKKIITLRQWDTDHHSSAREEGHHPRARRKGSHHPKTREESHHTRSRSRDTHFNSLMISGRP